MKNLTFHTKLTQIKDAYLGTAQLWPMYLPSPGLGLGFGKGWDRVRASYREGVGRDVAHNQAQSDYSTNSHHHLVYTFFS